MFKNFLGKISKKYHHRELSRHADLDGKSPSTSRKSGFLEYDASNIRLLVIRDTEQGFKRLFDSRLHFDGTKCNSQKVAISCRQSEDSGLASSRSGSFSGCSFSGSFNRVRSNSDRIMTSDVSILAEMMFGNVSMKIVGDSVKVHYIRSTDQFLLTKVFVHKPNSSTASCSLDPSECSSPYPSPLSSSNDNSVGNISRNYSSSSFTGDYRSSNSLTIPACARPPSQLSNESSSYMGSGGTGTGSKSNSYQRRLEHSWYTSFENEHRLYHHVRKPLQECSSKVTHGCMSGRKHKKIAVGLIFSLDDKQFSQFEHFFFTHFALIYSHLEELRLAVDDNLHSVNFKKTDWPEFHTNTRKAFDKFSKHFLSLYNTPRIEDPVWLTLVTRPDARKTVCAMFMKELMNAITKFDTKDTKFFMSTLLTAILTHHCAWIYTVSQDTPDRQEENKHKSKALDMLSKSHPYNSLWAQLGDLYGAITHPMTVTRTVVTGRVSQLVECLLFLLTYFIRCFDIEDICDNEVVGFPDIGSRCSSSMSGHLTPKEDHFSDGICGIRSSQAVTTPSRKKPNPFSFASLKSPIPPRTRNHSQSDKESLDLSSKSFCSGSAGSLLASPFKDACSSRSWHRPKALHHDRGLCKSEDDLTSSDCPSKTLLASGHSDCRTATADSLSLHTTNSDSPLFMLPTRSDSVSDSMTPNPLPNLTTDSYQCIGSGVRFSTKCQEYLQSCDVCSRASTPELQCSEECLLNQTCRLLFQTSSQCFIPRGACHECEKQYTCSFGPPNNPKPSADTVTDLPPTTAKRRPRFSQTVCENPYYVVFDPNCTYSSQRPKQRCVDKPQVSTRLPLIWPQNSWEEVPLDEGDEQVDPFEEPPDCSTTQTDDKVKESEWPTTGQDMTTGGDLVFPHNVTDYTVKQDSMFGVCNTSPVSKDSGNCSYTTSTRLENESLVTNEDTTGVFDFSVEESLTPSVIHQKRMNDSFKRSSLLAEQLQEYELAKEGGYLGLEGYVNFSEVDLSTCYDLETYERNCSCLDTTYKQPGGFSRSLVASVSDTYLPDFVLHGTTNKDFGEHLFEDLKAIVRCSVVDDPVDHAQAIVADTDDWNVKIVSVSRPADVWVQDYSEQSRTAKMASSVHSMLEATQVLWKMNMSAEFCLLHLEDRLQALNETGMLLGSCLAEHAEDHLPSNLTQLTKMFKVDISDLPLLLAVASAHSPDVGKILCAANQHRR
ncbi:folliculin-interacting protein 2-like isoform X2 [Dysidea avara]